MSSLIHGPDFSDSDEYDSDDGDYYSFKQRIQTQDNKVNEKPIEPSEKDLKTRQIENVYFAISGGNIKAVRDELDKGFDVNEMLHGGWTPLLLSASVGNYEMVKEFLDRGADVSKLKDGMNLLMLACNCPSTTSPFEQTCKIVQLLIKKGLNINAINRKRMTAIMFAANSGNLNAVKILLPLCDRNAEDNQKWTVLFWAVNGGYVEVVEYLLNEGLNYEKPDIRNNTPLDIARQNDFDSIIELFPEEESDVIATIINNNRTDIESIFEDLKPSEKPKFFLDICSLLYGMRSECLIRHFYEKDINLIDFLSSSERDLINAGVNLPYQRNRILGGLYKFHKHNFSPKSLHVVNKNEIYSNCDIAITLMSAIRQIIAMEASLKFILKNNSCLISNDQRREIIQSIRNMKLRLDLLKKVSGRLTNKVEIWDLNISDSDHIISTTRRRRFPWRKLTLLIGVGAIVCFRMFR